MRKQPHALSMFLRTDILDGSQVPACFVHVPRTNALRGTMFWGLPIWLAESMVPLAPASRRLKEPIRVLGQRRME